jgi:hypothetical protein
MRVEEIETKGKEEATKRSAQMLLHMHDTTRDASNNSPPPLLRSPSAPRDTLSSLPKTLSPPLLCSLSAPMDNNSNRKAELTVDVDAANKEAGYAANKEAGWELKDITTETGIMTYVGLRSSQNSNGIAKPAITSPGGSPNLSAGKDRKAYRVSFGNGIECPVCIAGNIGEGGGGGGGGGGGHVLAQGEQHTGQQVLVERLVLKQEHHELELYQLQEMVLKQDHRQISIEQENMVLRDKVETLLELRKADKAETELEVSKEVQTLLELRKATEYPRDNNQEHEHERESCKLSIRSAETNKLKCAVDGLRDEIAQQSLKLLDLAGEQQLVDDRLMGMHTDSTTQMCRLESHEDRLNIENKVTLINMTLYDVYLSYLSFHLIIGWCFSNKRCALVCCSTLHQRAPRSPHGECIW